MKQSVILICASALAAVGHAAPEPAAPDDPGWPRVFKQDKQELVVHQPQADHWLGYTNLHFRCAISVKTNASAQERFGAAEIDALTYLDQGTRTVTIMPVKRDVRFPNMSVAENAALSNTVERLVPFGRPHLIALDRLLGYLDPATHPQQRAVELSYDAPQILFSSKPAVLVIFLGPSKFKPVATNRTDLLFALNTNWDMFYDTTTQLFYLLNGDGWLSAPANGEWSPAKELPPSFSTLPTDDNWAEVRKRIAGKPAKTAPKVFVTTGPAELILTSGDPNYRTIKGTQLEQLSDTDSLVFVHTGETQFYLLAAGRWFRAQRLDGPWTPASRDVPAEFAKIPDDDPVAFVKASVPKTREAQDAVLLASVPSTITLNVTNVPDQVTYIGAPQFKPIEGTTVQSASNSPDSVFLVEGRYYWCLQGAWLCAANPTGPWAPCPSVPAALYSIPPSHPEHNVTYVVVQSATSTNVTYAQTSGYSGEYVAATGVLMFGAGLALGAALTEEADYYYPPEPIYYSYGCGAIYDYAYGGYYRAAYGWSGPYGGAGRVAAYNPITGRYSRGAYAYGPYGGAGVQQAYNPYTGAYAQRARVNTAYGSAGRFYAEKGNQSAWGGYRVNSATGTGYAAWNTSRGNSGAIAKTSSGAVFATSDGTVYRRDSSGNWSANNGSGWQNAPRPSPVARANPGSGGFAGVPPNIESQAQARQWGNQRVNQSASFRPASRGGGGRRR